MNRAIIVCLTILSLLVFDSTAEAGRRKERRASRKSGGGVYAGAYQKSSSNSCSPAPTYTATPTPAVDSAAPVVSAAPDLTITEIIAIGNSLAFTVKNVGQVASPACRLAVALAESESAELEAENVRVLPLLPNQSVRIKLNSVPGNRMHAKAFVDSDNLIAEVNEENNDLNVSLVTESTAEQPPVLTEESAWSHVGA